MSQKVRRARIDAIDREIEMLLLERRNLSRMIQAQRMAEGGEQIDSERERRVVQAHPFSMTRVFWSILAFCRGDK